MNTLLIVWKDEYNLGIPIIDEQHRGVVSTINSLFYSIKMKRAEETLFHIINTMREYTEIHFATEEEILAKVGYPTLAAHKELHARLMAKNLAVGEESLVMNDPVAFLGFLKDWWMYHINRQDRMYAPLVKQVLRLE